jgi:hypothetical protein
MKFQTNFKNWAKTFTYRKIIKGKDGLGLLRLELGHETLAKSEAYLPSTQVLSSDRGHGLPIAGNCDVLM